MVKDNLPPGVSVFDPHINPPDEDLCWRTCRGWVLDATPQQDGDTDYRTWREAVLDDRLPTPVSHDEMVGTFVAQALIGSRHNLTGTRTWWAALQEAEAVHPPYPFCHGNPTELDCIMVGYCQRELACDE